MQPLLRGSKAAQAAWLRMCDDTSRRPCAARSHDRGERAARGLCQCVSTVTAPQFIGFLQVLCDDTV